MPVIPPGLTATIDGTSWIARTYYATVDSTYPSDLLLTVYGADSVTGTEINLSVGFFKYNASTYSITYPGQYLYSSTSAGCSYNGDSSAAYAGTIIIYQVSADSIKGAFGFTAGDITVTYGQFDMPIAH